MQRDMKRNGAWVRPANAAVAIGAALALATLAGQAQGQSIEKASPAKSKTLASPRSHDFNGDGSSKPDVLVRAISHDAAGSVTIWYGDGGGGVKVVSGEPGDLFGFAASAAGDLDGDGADDLIVGAPLAGEGLGALHLFSGRTGETLGVIRGAGHLGLTVAGVGTLGGDVAIVAAAGGDGVSFYAHGTSEPLVTIAAPGTPDGFGGFIQAVDDIDADGIGDVVIASVAESAAHLYSGASILAGKVSQIGTLPVSGCMLGATSAGDGTGAIDVVTVSGMRGAAPVITTARFDAAGRQVSVASREGLLTPGDIDMDFIVDQADIDLVVHAMGMPSGESPFSGDADGIGGVDGEDLAIVLSAARDGRSAPGDAGLLNRFRELVETREATSSASRTGDGRDQAVIRRIVEQRGRCYGFMNVEEVVPVDVDGPVLPPPPQPPQPPQPPPPPQPCPTGQMRDCRGVCCGPGRWEEAVQSNSSNPVGTGTPYFPIRNALGVWFGSGEGNFQTNANPAAGSGSVMSWGNGNCAWYIFSNTFTASSSASISWNYARVNRWIGTGPACARGVYLSASGGGSESISVTCGANAFCTAAASASGSASCDSLGNASADMQMQAISLDAAYSSATDKVNISGNAAGQVEHRSASVNGTYSAESSWTIQGTGSKAGSASYSVAKGRSYRNDCTVQGYTVSQAGSVAASGSANWGSPGSANWSATSQATLRVN